METKAMATTKIYLDTRSVKAGCPAPLKIQLTHNRKVTFIPLNIKLKEEQWDKVSSTIVSHPQKRMLNEVIRIQLSKVEVALHNILGIGKRTDITLAELKNKILLSLNGEGSCIEDNNETGVFLSRFESYRDRCATNGTRSVYQQTINRMKAFDSKIGNKNFEDIDRKWLMAFETFLTVTSKSPNARSVHFRNIRTVFNDALDDEIITCYPFRKFKIKSAPTAKRSLTVEQLRLLKDYPCEEYQKKYRDMFMLMFYLRGINAVDLFNAHADAIVNGRLEYIRAKTHKSYSVKIEPEAMKIIEKYRGEKYLLNIMDFRSNYKDFLHRMDKTLKQIGEIKRIGLGGKKKRSPLFPKLSQYWCRHTWATIAAELDIPKETIAAGLGHELGNTTTSIYINFNTKKVDIANRQIIDYVLSDKESI